MKKTVGDRRKGFKRDRDGVVQHAGYENECAAWGAEARAFYEQQDESFGRLDFDRKPAIRTDGPLEYDGQQAAVESYDGPGGRVVFLMDGARVDRMTIRRDSRDKRSGKTQCRYRDTEGRSMYCQWSQDLRNYFFSPFLCLVCPWGTCEWAVKRHRFTADQLEKYRHARRFDSAGRGKGA